MPRLLRPHTPVAACCRVALRQLGEMWPDVVLLENAGRLGALLDDLLTKLADLLGCAVKDLHLDHDPALENRPKLVELASGYRVRRVVLPKGARVIRYFPDAVDPEHLIYREKRAHHIKTNVRGDGAQHPDRVLAKRERKRVNRSKRGVDPGRKTKASRFGGSRPLTSCALSSRCSCDRRARKRCGNWRAAKIGGPR